MGGGVGGSSKVAKLLLQQVASNCVCKLQPKEWKREPTRESETTETLSERERGSPTRGSEREASDAEQKDLEVPLVAEAYVTYPRYVV